MKLTAKQEKFVAIYAGNGTQAARAAGYEGNDDTLAATASRLLKNDKVRSAISRRNSDKPNGTVASREERQSWWTRVMNDDTAALADRIAASVHLGKSEGDFVERIEMKDTTPLSERLAKALARVKAMAIVETTATPILPAQHPNAPEARPS